MIVSGIVLSFPNTQLEQLEVLVVEKISEVYLTLETIQSLLLMSFLNVTVKFT